MALCALCESYISPRFAFTGSFSSLFDARKDAEREEQWRIQQEILAKRKNPKLLEKKKLEVEERRKQVDRDVKKTMWGSDRSADNLDAWKKAKEQGLIKDLGYEEITPEKKRSVFGFSVPIVQSPIDLPGYDNGNLVNMKIKVDHICYCTKLKTQHTHTHSLSTRVGQRFDLRLPYAERGYEDPEAGTRTRPCYARHKHTHTYTTHSLTVKHGKTRRRDG